MAEEFAGQQNVIAVTFAEDSKAFEIYGKLFAGREVVQVPAREVAFGGAGLRAIALGQPAGQPAT